MERPQTQPIRVPRLLPIVGAVFALALLINVLYAYTRPVPVSADAAYYVMVAENLYHGRGFVADYVWNYLAGLPRSLPVPSNEYWMPGTSVVTAVVFAAARGASLRAAQWPSLLLGALLCAITAWVAGALSRRRDVAWLAGAAAALNFYLVGLALYPDHFMLNAVLVNLSLLALWRAWTDRGRLAAPAGALAGLAFLTRTDGGLLVICALLLAIGLWRRGERRHALRLTALFLAAFALVAAPWWIRQTLVFGSPSGASPLRTAFLTDYNDLFRLDQSRLNPQDYLATSQVVALGVKGYVLYRSLRVLAKAVMLFGLLFIAALFLRDLRRPAVPWLAYLALGLLIPPLLVPYPAGKGGSWHLMPALMPIILALGASAAFRLFDTLKHRLRSSLAGALVIALSLGSLLYWWARSPEDAARAADPLYPPVAAEAVRALGPSPRPALTDNAWGLYHVTHLPCAQFPTDGAVAALQVADAIGAGYLITRADATNQIPTMSEIINHPRFQPLARYPAGETSLLVYRIVPSREYDPAPIAHNGLP